MKLSLGRYVYGLAAIGFGICALASNDSNNWQQEVKALGDIPHREILSYIVAAVLIRCCRAGRDLFRLHRVDDAVHLPAPARLQ